MRTLTFVKRRSLAVAVTGALLSVLMLSSCLKDNNNNNTPQPPVALLSVVQAVPDAPQLDFYLDNDRVTLQPLAYNQHIDYLRAYVGKRSAIFNNYGTNTKVFADSILLQENVVYSLFVSNTTANPKFLLTTDSIARPSGNQAAVRLVNLSPDVGPVDLVVRGGSTVVTNRAYNTASPFVQVPGGNTYTFEIHKTGTNTVLATLSGALLNSGSVYTIWVHGFANGTGSQAIGADAMLNAYF